MRDNGDGTLVLDLPRRRDDSGHVASAQIIPFPGSRRATAATGLENATTERDITAVFNNVAAVLGPRCAAHAPSVFAALGALVGFATQQKLIAEGGAAWAQPNRAEHLDRFLLSEQPRDGSLWCKLRAAAAALGVQHLPDPNKLLDATLRCVGTTQFGLITLPLEYKLLQQPQASLQDLWAPLSVASTPSGVADLFGEACARRVAVEQRAVPPHVALRIVMQAALAMALIEPRVIPGAMVKPKGH